MDTKVCNVCHHEKPTSEFYAKRSDCKACSAKRMRNYNQTRRASARQYGDRHRVFDSIYDAHRALVVAVISQSFKDGSGQGILSEEYRRFGQEKAHAIMMDGLRFFEDGRFKSWAERIGLCPELEVKWPGKGK